MSAVINWDFAVDRWTKTITEVYYNEGPEEADSRTDHLPRKFKERLIANMKGDDVRGRAY